MKSIALSVLSAWAMVAQAARPDWTRYVIFPEGADYEVESRSAESFVIRARRTDEKVDKTGALAIASVDRDMWTHNRLAMTVRSLNGKRVDVGMTVSHPNGSGKTVMTSAPGIEVSGRAWRQVVLGLDTDFGLGDCNIRIVQVKIGAWVSHWKHGDEGGIEVKDLRLCGPDEVATSDVWRKGDEFVSVPSGELPKFAAAKDAMRVYFAFDNEDVIDSIHRRKRLTDRQQFGGFRETLLEHLDGKATWTTDVKDADVIVYSRCAPDPTGAEEIVRAVTERGVPLYAASEVGDPEIEAILPCAIGHEAPEDLPRRAKVCAKAGHPLFARGGLSDAAFGVYRTVTPRQGSRTLLSFADGTPALVEGRAGKGRVMYNMICIGASLVPGKESPDAFLIRALGCLTNRTLPERDRKDAARTKDGWWHGIGADSFGRFGWEVGSGLLVEQVGSRLKVKNGDASYEFGMPRRGDKLRKVTFAGDRAESLSLGGEVRVDGEPACRVDMSLAYPGVRWQIRRREIELHLGNLNAFVRLPAGRTVDLAAGGEIDVRGLTKPWLLLFNGSDRDSPLLLVLQHRPARIEVLRRGAAVDGLRLVASGETVGTVVPTWIFGAKTVDTTAWESGVPQDALTRAEWWYPHAFAYPIRCREEFLVDSAAKRIRIRSRYGYARTADDWQTPRAQYAALSPMAWNLKGVKPAAGGDEIVATEPDVKSTGLVTTIGDLAVKDGADRVEWSLPLFEPDLSLLPHVLGENRFDDIANAQFSSGVRFTCGGGVKVDYRKDKLGCGAGRGEKGCLTLNMHGSTMGLCRCSPNPFVYSEENRRLMRRRMAWRMLEPLETMQYKMVCRWRREPVSGLRYTIYMNSPRDVSTRYEPEEYGSKIIYGDSNETVRMILSCIKVLEDRMGQHGLVRANWDAISRHIASYEKVIDDWGIMASGCLEWGGPGCIDMLNSEFGCLMTLARLAEIAGDEAERAQALYRASRRMCPTLARFKMLAYHRQHGLLPNPDLFRAATGFNEQGACFHVRGRKPQDIDFLDMSQGIPQDLISLYRWYGWDELRTDYFFDVRKAVPGKGLDYITTATLALGDDLPDAELRAKLTACADDEKLNRWLHTDWPGMDTGSFIEYTLHRLYKSPVITDCRGVTLHDATWNPETRQLNLTVTPGEGAALAVDGRPVRLGPVGCRQTLVVESAAKGGLEPLTRELDKVLADRLDETAVRRMRGKQTGEKPTEADEQKPFEESKVETAKMVEKVKAVRTKAAATVVPSATENEKTKFLGSKQPWAGTKICDALPFSVEYRRSHAFLAEYDKRIRFRSGKRVGIVGDTGGAGDFAAYALQDGKVYLVDGLDHVWIRSEYRVDAASESVEKKCGETWVRIPDESLGVVSWSDSSLTVKTASGERSAEKGVPVGGSMKGKRYLGRVTPRGEFTADGPEPSIQKDEVAWNSSKITEGVPFAYEWGESKTYKSFARIVFKSGKKVVTRGGMRNKDGECRVYRLPDERFLLTFREGTMWEEMYGIGLKEETVDLICKGWRLRIPDDARAVEGWAAGADGMSIDVVTPKGRVKICGKERVPDLTAEAQYVGMLTKDGSWRLER